MEFAGDRPPRYGEKTLPLHVGRGPVPRHAKRAIQRSRGKPARMRVWHPRAPALRLSRPLLLHRRARACPSPSFAHPNARGEQAPVLRLSKPPLLHRRARACPSPSLRVSQRSRGTGPRATVKIEIWRARRNRDREVSPTGTSRASRPGRRAEKVSGCQILLTFFAKAGTFMRNS